jgi:hypothetical protein
MKHILMIALNSEYISLFNWAFKGEIDYHTEYVNLQTESIEYGGGGGGFWKGQYSVRLFFGHLR